MLKGISSTLDYENGDPAFFFYRPNPKFTPPPKNANSKERRKAYSTFFLDKRMGLTELAENMSSFFQSNPSNLQSRFTMHSLLKMLKKPTYKCPVPQCRVIKHSKASENEFRHWESVQHHLKTMHGWVPTTPGYSSKSKGSHVYDFSKIDKLVSMMEAANK